MKHIFLFLSFIFLVSFATSCSDDESETIEPSKLFAKYLVDTNCNGNYQEVFLTDAEKPKPTIGTMAWLEKLYAALKYPPEARDKGIEGTVTFHIYVNKLGQATEVLIKQGLSNEIDESCINALTIASKDGYYKLMSNGQPSKYIIESTIKFKLE